MMDFDENDGCEESVARILNADGVAETYDKALEWVQDIHDHFELAYDVGETFEERERFLQQKGYPQEAIDAVVEEWDIKSWEWGLPPSERQD